MAKSSRFAHGSALLLLVVLCPVALAQSSAMRKAQELFDQQEYAAAQEALQKVDVEQLNEAEKQQREQLLKILPEAVQGARKAEGDKAEADKLYDAGKWDDSERLYRAVAENKYAKVAMRSAAETKIDQLVEKRHQAAANQSGGSTPPAAASASPAASSGGSGSVQIIDLNPATTQQPSSSSGSSSSASTSSGTTARAPAPAADGGARPTVVGEMRNRDALLWERAYAKMQEMAVKAREAKNNKQFDEARRLADYAVQAIESARAYAEPPERYESARKLALDLRDEIEQAAKENEKSAAEIERSEIQERILRRKALHEQAKAEKIEQLFNTAKQLRQEQRYSEAASVLREVLYIDPANAKARDQLEVMEDYASFRLQADLSDEQRNETRKALVNAEEAKIPWDYEVLYPKNWLQVTARRGGAAAGVVGAYAEDTELNKRLEESLPEVRFDDTPFRSAIENLQDTQGVNISVDWEDLSNNGIDADKPVSLRLKNVTFGTLLKEMLTQIAGDAGLTYRIGDGLIRIATKDKLDRDKRILVYDVRDLLVSIPRFKNAPTIDPTQALAQMGQEVFQSRGNFFQDNDDNENVNAPGAEHGGIGDPAAVAMLMDTIRQTVMPESWRESGSGDGSMRELNGNLIVYNTSDAHRQVSNLLGQLRETRALQVALETRFLTITNNYLEEIGVDLDFVLNSGTAGFDRAFTPGQGGVPSPLFDPYTGSPVLIPRDFSRTGRRPANPAYGAPLVPTVAVNQPYGDAGFVPIGDGFPPNNNYVTPIPINSASQTLAGVNNINTGVPGSLASQVGLNPALNIAGSYLDNLQVDFLIRATQANNRSSVVQAPRLLLFNGQRANISVGRNQQYVASVRPVLAEGVVGFQPIPANAFSGTTLDVEGTISADRKYVTVTVRTAQLKDPRFNRFEVQRASGNSPGVFITLLDQETANINTTVSIPDGGTVLMGGLKQVGEVELEAGVPILSKIPVLKRAFTNTSTVKDTQTLLILMKAKIIIQKEAEEEAFPTMVSDAG